MGILLKFADLINFKVVLRSKNTSSFSSDFESLFTKHSPGETGQDVVGVRRAQKAPRAIANIIVIFCRFFYVINRYCRIHLCIAY